MFMETDVTGVLLAGGKSRRMGEDKRFLLVGEQTLLDRGLAVLRSIFQEVLVVIAQDSLPLNVVNARVVRDLLPNCGSLGGVYTGLKEATTPYIFVAACDMPFLNPSVIAEFTSRRATVDIVMATLATQLHPMHALYGKGCLTAMEQMLVSGQLKIQDLALNPSLRVQQITEEDVRSTDPAWRSFHNVNTPADLEAAYSLLAQMPPSQKS
jgi:molybdopterin-guanine dinucleotide biosynthesis protein A